jgi:glycosyltransferase involved in cell wall biosynthesis
MLTEGCNATSFGNKSLLMVLNGWNGLKNGANALRAFAKAYRTDSTLQLNCFGAGFELNGPANRWAKRNGFDAGVNFLGSISHEMILKTMQSSTALLHPSRWEACCMAIGEAMSLGLPVIAGRYTDGVAWQLDGGRAGTLVDVTDVNEMAQAIISMSNDWPVWQHMSVAARERARQLFALDKVVDQYESMYKQVLASAQETHGVQTVTQLCDSSHG